MNTEAYWQIIDDARRASGKLTDMPRLLIDLLCKLDEREIADYQTHYIDCLFRSYDAKLWLAASVIMGGCSDDSFSDFRCWLIAQGRNRFEVALENPDSLSELESIDGDDGYPSLFYFGSVGHDAFCKRLGVSKRDFDALQQFGKLVPRRKYPDLKQGELLTMSDEDARMMFPQLAAKFPNGIF